MSYHFCYVEGTSYGCVHNSDYVEYDQLKMIIDRTFPYRAVFGDYGRVREMRQWLKDRLGYPLNILTTWDPNTFFPYPAEVNTDWGCCLVENCTFGFKNRDDAILFRLTWG